MKRMISFLVCSMFMIGLTTGLQARTVGLVDSTDEGLRASFELSHSVGDFSELETEPDTEFKSSFFGVRLEKSLGDHVQAYVSGGKTANEFSDSDVQDGLQYGGGLQIVFQEAENLRYKLVGSYHEHSEEDFVSDADRSLKIIDDWQAGLLINRLIPNKFAGENTRNSSAYMGLLYSERKLEITDGSTTTKYEYSDYEGVTVMGGIRIQADDGLALDLEAETGSTTSGSARVSVRF
jgi:hypothetical protein